jgi:hypothetical protein
MSMPRRVRVGVREKRGREERERREGEKGGERRECVDTKTGSGDS